MLVSFIRPNKIALDNLQKQMNKQSRGGKFMFNFQFDKQTSDKACKILDDTQEDQLVPKVIDDLDPKLEEEIHVGRDI